MIEARIRIQSANQRISNSIIECLKPDNTEMKDLSITPKATRNSVSFSMAYEGRIETFISTLDDLLGCIQAANATLGIIRKNKTR